MQREELVAVLTPLIGRENIAASRADLYAYGYDASIFQGGEPGAVVFPDNTEQIAQVVRFAHQHNIPYIARGAGSNISGGTIPIAGCLIIALSRLNRILEIDIPNQRAVVEPGVINLDLKKALAPYGYTYAPDPGSQSTSTIGGNVAENAGGPRCLKYGITTNHILGLEVVLPGGEIAQFGGKALDEPGYDLTGLFVGSEGMLGIATKIIVKIIHLPEFVTTQLAIFDSQVDAAEAVSDIIASGYLPTTLEMMDRAVIQVVEAHVHAGYPLDAEAVLIIELDGLQDGMTRAAQQIADICKKHRAREVKIAQNAAEQDQIWLGRRKAFGAIARLRPSAYTVDGVVPRNKLPGVLARVLEICDKYKLQAGNVFHAGDGNIHPVILFDERNPEEKALVVQAGIEILQACVEAGGTITGEHGVGLEKQKEMRLLYTDQDLTMMEAIKEAFDPQRLSNPNKMLPQLVSGV